MTLHDAEKLIAVIPYFVNFSLSAKTNYSPESSIESEGITISHPHSIGYHTLITPNSITRCMLFVGTLNN